MANQLTTIPTTAEVDLTIGTSTPATVSVGANRPAILTYIAPDLWNTHNDPIVRVVIDLPGELGAVVEIPARDLTELLWPADSEISATGPAENGSH